MLIFERVQWNPSGLGSRRRARDIGTRRQGPGTGVRRGRGTGRHGIRGYVVDGMITTIIVHHHGGQVVFKKLKMGPQHMFHVSRVEGHDVVAGFNSIVVLFGVRVEIVPFESRAGSNIVVVCDVMVAWIWTADPTNGLLMLKLQHGCCSSLETLVAYEMLLFRVFANDE